MSRPHETGNRISRFDKPTRSERDGRHHDPDPARTEDGDGEGSQRVEHFALSPDDFDGRERLTYRAPDRAREDFDPWGDSEDFGALDGGGGYVRPPHHRGVPYEDTLERVSHDGMPQGGFGERGSVRDYVGHGPKGYTRADARIYEDICERLTASPYIDPRDVTVEVQSGSVRLEGTVDRPAVKYAIEDIVGGVSGIKDVHNRIQVAGADAPERDGNSPGR